MGVAVVAVGGVAALLLFFNSRDEAPVSAPPQGPGQAFPDQGAQRLAPGQRPTVAYNSNPPTSGPHAPVPVRASPARLSDDQILSALEIGNVVLVYGTSRPPAALSALARDTAGPFDPALAAGGQAVILAQRPGTTGVVALAWRHLLRANSATDPVLRRFIEFHLGRGRT